MGVVDRALLAAPAARRAVAAVDDQRRRQPPCRERRRRCSVAGGAVAAGRRSVALVARLHPRRRSTSSCRSSARCTSRCGAPAVPSAYTQRPRRPEVLRRASATRSRSASSRSSSASLIIVPTAFWVRLKVPRLRPVVEFITLLPFVIPPIVLVFGLIRIYSRAAAAADRAPTRAATSLLVGAYVDPVVPVHVPGGRHGPRGDRRPDADRGGPEPGRRLAPDPLAGSSSRTCGSPC